MNKTKRNEIVINLIKDFSDDLTETEKLLNLNEELLKKKIKPIGRTTYYNLKRKNPGEIIANKGAERRAKQKNRTDYQRRKEECIQILSKREKISIDESKSFVELIVVNEGTKYDRRRTRVNFNYVISDIQDDSSVDEMLIGFELTQSVYDICRQGGKYAKPTIKALKLNDLNKYDQKLCKSKHLKWIQTIAGTHKKPAILVFRFTKGRFESFKGKLDRESLRQERTDFTDPRTLFNDKERWKWLKADLSKNNCKLLEKEWKGSRGRVRYYCPKGHFNEPLLTNYFRSRNAFSCPTCNEGGFDPSKPAWFYLMEKEEEQQFGITNYKKQRLDFHIVDGWKEIEWTDRSYPGKEVEATEKALKVWLKNEVGLLPYRTERWKKNKKNIRSLKQLKEESGVETSIF